MAEHRFVTVNGIRTHYVAAGKGEPLLLLHGLGASLMAWGLNIEPLSQEFSVYAIDIPGHGDSEKPDLDYQMPTAVNFVRGFMDALGLERASIAGSSMGGMIALSTAVEYPELVNRLVLVDAAGLGREVAWFLRAMSLPLVGELIENPSPQNTRVLLKRIFYNPSLVQESLIREIYRTRFMPGSKRAVLRIIRGAIGLRGLHSKWIMTNELEQLNSPVLIVWGAQDRILPVSHATNAARIAPQVSLSIFDECGHWPQMERGNEFNRVALDFLTEE